MDAVSLLKVPTFGQDDLAAFHEAHFGLVSTKHFDQTYLSFHDNVAEEYQYEEEEEEDDGLGYYPDGVKRTLTDEQIAIFRHSEEEALRRAAEKTKDSAMRIEKSAEANSKTTAPGKEEELEEGEEVDDDGIITKLPPSKKKNKNKKRKGRGQWQKEQKPDLRRRTWDVVEKGVGSLDYDEMEGVQATTTHAAKRKRISYDD